MTERIPRRITWAVEQLDVRATHRVLEIGCGGGLALRLLASRAKEVVGIDRSAQQVATARSRNPGLTVERMTLAEAAKKLRPKSFDRILAVNVNAFWKDPEESLPQVVSMLRSGGRLALVWEWPSRELVAITGVRETRRRKT